MAKNTETTTKFKVDVSELKSGLKSANDAIALTNSEFKKSTAGMESWGKSADGLTSKIKQLKSVNENYTKILDAYKNKYDEVVRTEGEGSEAAQSLKIKINNLEAAIKGNEAAIEKYSDDMEELGNETEKTSGKFGDFLKGLGKATLAGVGTALAGVGAGVAYIGKQALESYAQYEQLIGGVETLFKDSSDQLVKYANDAYKTAGLSANDYMEQATSFSASLIQGLGGDTEKAAAYADRAITDMSDNANKMGTSIDLIQNAYQGFAKGNFTMLDNLKLGYGGTQAEMLRLVNDSGILEEKIDDINDVSFDQMIDAIHAVQENMGIAGTTAAEASETIEGSVSAMKSAWGNLITGIADDTMDFDQLINNFVDSVVTVGDNILPRISTIIVGIGKLIAGLSESLIPEIANTLPSIMSELLPLIVDSFGHLSQGILDAIPQLMPAVTQLVTQLVEMLVDLLPQLLDVGLQVIIQLATGIAKALPTLLPQIVDVVLEIVDVLIENIPLIIDAGVQLLMGLVEALPKVIKKLVAALPTIIKSIIDALVKAIPQLTQAAVQLFMAIIDALPVIIDAIVDNLPMIVEAITNGLIEATPELIQASITLFMALVQAIPIIVEELIAVVPQIITAIIESLAPLAEEFFIKISEVIGKVIEWAANVKKTFKEKVTEIITAIVNWFKQLPGKIYNAIKSAINKVVTWGNEMKSKAITAATTFVSAVIDNIKSLPDKVAKWLSGVITKLSNWVTDMGNKGREAASSLIQKLKSGFNNIATDMWNIGSNIVSGIWDGISGNLRWIKNQISGWVGNVTDFIKGLFGIASPSKVMRDEVGKWLPLGIAEGIENNTQAAVNAMKNTGKKILNASETMKNNIGFDGTSSGSIVNNFTQNNYSPKSLTRLEIYRQSKNLLSMKGV